MDVVEAVLTGEPAGVSARGDDEAVETEDRSIGEADFSRAQVEPRRRVAETPLDVEVVEDFPIYRVDGLEHADVSFLNGHGNADDVPCGEARLAVDAPEHPGIVLRVIDDEGLPGFRDYADRLDTTGKLLASHPAAGPASRSGGTRS